jgi:NAD(P)H-hydrate epimerase
MIQIFPEFSDFIIHADDIKKINTSLHYANEAEIAALVPKRNKFAHKGDFGHALLIAGSRGKVGAAVLAAKACMRSGAGLLTVHVPACAETIVHTSFPEAMLEPDEEADFISETVNLSKYKAIGIGPGIGLEKKTARVLLQLFQTAHQPLVVDADAINLVARNSALQEMLPPGSILTPHPKEFDRLAGNSANSFERLQKAVEWAVRFQSYVVLKGANTAICTPDRQCYFNPTGNPGMATAGSGDVLTGIILGLLAQSYSPLAAALVGVFLHGLSGDIAADQNSQESLIASDIIEHLGSAFKKISYICNQTNKI